MNKTKKNIIILLIILIIIILLLLLIVIGINKKEEEEILSQTTQEIDEDKEEIQRLDLVKNKKEYLSIKKCLNQYISGINTQNSIYYGRDENNNYTLIVDNETINTNIYNLLSENYKTKNNININNVRDYVYNITEHCYYVPVDIYVKYTTDTKKSYAIYGIIEDLNYKIITESYVILNIDQNNQTFSIEQLNNIEDFENITIENINTIPIMENNVFDDINGVINEELLKEYINTYKNLVLANPEIVYNKFLDDEYKQKKFGTFENYKEYIKENKKYIETITLKEYSILENLEYIQYIAVDNKGKYYIFNIDNIFNYTILLDNYTVDIPYFIEKYNKSNSLEKGGYNIEKCIEAINNKDYIYVYNKLYDEFKNNNYKTEESFEKAIKNKLFDTNVMKIVSTENEGNVYIYNLNIQDGTNSEKQTNMKIIMQLKEGTDFAISFSF